MRTTQELPDDLLIEAKMMAARRRTTLKALVEYALRREIASQSAAAAADCTYQKEPYGIPGLKKREGGTVTSETVYRLMEQESIC